MAITRVRSGRYIQQPTGYSAFVPKNLPPDPPLRIDAEMARLISDADRALGRLDGVASVLPNAELFVAMYVRQEAVLSSQIEGTQSTLEDVLQFEIEGRVTRRALDVEEVVNYVSAMNHGLRRLSELPLSLRLIREIHAELLRHGRGAERSPGEFRRSQNWIGPGGSTLAQAVFIPPPPHEMLAALANLEEFLHDRESLPMLVHCAVAHAQFETIHPFLDGNGRVGRLLITFLLCERQVLQQPLLYLSYYLKVHRSEYYDRLMGVRHQGDWESWVKFFLRGVFEVSQGATSTARAILDLRDKHGGLIRKQLSASAGALPLLDYLFQSPIVSVRMVQEHLGCSYVTASNLVNDLQRIGILREITGRQRHRQFRYDPYLDLFERQIFPREASPRRPNRPRRGGSKGK